MFIISEYCNSELTLFEREREKVGTLLAEGNVYD